MQKNLLALLFLLILQPLELLAGSRGVSLAFFDATTGERSKASLRLAELLEKDMKALYTDPQIASVFPWSEQNLELKILKPSEVGLTFDRLLNPKKEKTVASSFEKFPAPDGLIVFCHDAEGGFARLKLYNYDGSEVLLLRLPLEGKESAMADSLMKGHRQGALIAIGAAVRWGP